MSETNPETNPELFPKPSSETIPELSSETTPELSLTPAIELEQKTEQSTQSREESTEKLTEKPTVQSSLPEALPSPLRSLTGALIAGGFAFGLYRLTQSIATSFATKPLTSTNPIALSISAAVRTLVVGASTLATGIFAIAAFSLVLLAIQVALQPSKTEVKN